MCVTSVHGIMKVSREEEQMATSGIVGAVAGLWRFPVKSMRGERLEQAEFTEHGLVGDHAYALIDEDTGKVVSAKSVRLFRRETGISRGCCLKSLGDVPPIPPYRWLRGSRRRAHGLPRSPDNPQRWRGQRA
jgi:hypothetical protein